MTHFLVTDDKPDGYRLEDILMLIRKDMLTRAYDLAEAVVSSVLDWRTDTFGGYAVIVTEGPSSDAEALDADSCESSVTLGLHVTAVI